MLAKKDVILDGNPDGGTESFQAINSSWDVVIFITQCGASVFGLSLSCNDLLWYHIVI